MPLISAANVEPLASETLVAVRMPGLSPGATVAPLATFTAPAAFTVPVPPSVVGLFTLTFVAVTVPVTRNVPPMRVMSPVPAFMDVTVTESASSRN